MSSSGVKRSRAEIEHEEAASRAGLPYEDAGARSSREGGTSARGEKPVPKKPKDWREAFLDDDAPSDAGRRRHDSRDGRDRERERDRDYRDRRGGGDRDRYRSDDSRGGREYREDRGQHTKRPVPRSHEDSRDPRGDHRPSNGHGGGSGDARYSSSSRREPDRYTGADRHASPSKRDDRGGRPEVKSSRVDADEGDPARSVHGSPSSSRNIARSTSLAPAPMPSDIGKVHTTHAMPDDTPPVPLSATEEPVDLDSVLEERRRRRRELLEKFAGTQSGMASTATSVHGGISSALSNGKTASLNGLHTSTSRIALESSANTPVLAPPSSAQSFDLTKEDEQGQVDILPAETQASVFDGAAQISAADYNPLDDRKADDDRSHQLAAQHEIDQVTVATGVGEPVVGQSQVEEEDEYEEVEVEDEDEEFDMFAEDVAPKEKKKVLRKKVKEAAASAAPKVIPAIPVVDVSTLIDNFDDHEGYYRITPGEILDGGKYQVTVNLGKGMFSAVIRAKVLKATEKGEVVGGEVAIKMIRSQESMYVAGRKEAAILTKLCAADPEDKKHVVRLYRTFEHRGHLCLVTESLSMNLRDVVKRFGKDVGLNLRAVRAYAHQMFLALSLMKKCNVVHADIKPDNILVTESKAVLKVCDLGSACDASDSDITPYLVSRFYRAPEIILGLPYDESLDMWSIGCTLYELYTGKILFPGRSNNHMLLLMMDLKGKFNHKMIKKAQFGPMHFDEGMNFISVEKDKITGNDVVKTVIITKASRELKARLLPSSSVQLKMKEEDIKLLVAFVDLLDKCLALDPGKRLSAREALLHPFLSSP